MYTNFKKKLKNDINVDLIDFNEQYEFHLLEAADISKNEFKHPAMDYFLTINDLSANLEIKLKWLKWGFFFFNSLSKEFLNPKREARFNFFDNVQEELKTIKKKDHVLLLDNFIIENETQMMDVYENFYKGLITSNQDVKLKLKLNLDEFLMIDNLYIPIMTKSFRK